MAADGDKIPARSAVSWLRVLLLLLGLFAMAPLTIFFGLYGFITAVFFLLLVAFAA